MGVSGRDVSVYVSDGWMCVYVSDGYMCVDVWMYRREEEEGLYVCLIFFFVVLDLGPYLPSLHF